MIEIETTQNQNVRNFYFSVPLLKNGESVYAENVVESLPVFLQNIFLIGDIKRLLLLPDMLFVEKMSEGDFEILEPQIMAQIMEAEPFKIESKGDIASKIEALIEARVRPFLQKDGGNIEVCGFQNGILNVRFEGHCRGCPHADRTLKNAVESVLKQYIPEIKEVIKEGA